MSDTIETQTIHTGDVRETLPELPTSSVHMCMTSPPYWQLRDYGDGVVSVWGGDRDCDHDWHSAGEVKRGGQNTDANPPDVGGNSHAQDTGIRGDGVESHGCRHCGAWRGQLGLEPTREQFISNLVTVFREIRRVLRPDGSVWLNLGDTFKNKQKQLIPHRVAIALQEAGWVVRNDVTWLKPNPMPSSVKDRLNTTTEQIFHLTPQADYWYDLDAIREPHMNASVERAENDFTANINRGGLTDRTDMTDANAPRSEQMNHPAGKNPGDVFEVTTKPFPDAHFAVYPAKLCEKPIKASCPPKACVDCGAPYKRETEQVPIWEQSRENIDRPQTRRALELADEHGLGDAHFEAAKDVGIGNLDLSEGNPYHRVDEETATLAKEAADVLDSYYREALLTEARPTDNWRQTCDCDTDDTEPGIVLDPFAGAGTTLLKAKELGRRFVGVELNPDYADMARARVGIDVDDASRIRDDAQQHGLEGFAE